MACLHFELTNTDGSSNGLGNSGDLASALDNTNTTEPSVFSAKSWSALREAADSLTLSNPKFLMYMRTAGAYTRSLFSST